MLLGEGCAGQAFRAFDTALRRPVALKVLRRQDPHLLSRFLREAQTKGWADLVRLVREAASRARALRPDAQTRAELAECDPRLAEVAARR